MTFYEQEEPFSFYRVNFLQEKIFLQEKDINSSVENSINDSSKKIYELKEKSSEANTNEEED